MSCEFSPREKGAGTERQVLAVIFPEEKEESRSDRLDRVLAEALEGREFRMLTDTEQICSFLEGRKLASEGISGPEGAPGTAPGAERLTPVLFVISLGKDGVNLEYTKLLRFLRTCPGILDGCIAGVITDGESDLYTKSVARELVFTANEAGCAFVGRPLVEGTRTLSNFAVVAQIMETDEPSAYRRSAALLVKEILEFRRKKTHRPKLLVLHASIRKTSNTLALWNKTEACLKASGAELDIRTISLQNGTLYDCAGCPYRTCLHYGEQGSCFYGGVMAEEVYPAVREADAIVMLCANYNDALSANLTAFINRLTALFRQVRFYEKALFGVVVSGYSGSDIVAEQLIAALNMNKTFYLPPRFALLETANNAGQAVQLPGINDRVRAFAENILETLQPEYAGGAGRAHGQKL